MMANDGAFSPSFKIAENNDDWGMTHKKRQELYSQEKESIVAQVFIQSRFAKMCVEWDNQFIPELLKQQLGDRSSPWGLPYPTSEPLILLSRLGDIVAGMKENETILGKTAEQMVDAAKNVLGMYAKWVENADKIPNAP